jgi:hypothetical protein
MQSNSLKIMMARNIRQKWTYEPKEAILFKPCGATSSKGSILFPNHLQQVAFFPTWIRIVVGFAIKKGEVIDKGTIHMSMPPTLKATTY